MAKTGIAKVFSAELEGIAAKLIEVETDLHVGLHAFTIVGLADKALSESKERINAALKNSGWKAPNRENRKVVVNLAPADIKKTGSQYDLAIAVGYLLASGQLARFNTAEYLFAGELALDGSLRAVAGAMNIARLAASLSIPYLVVPAANAPEAALIPGITVFGVRTLRELVEHLEGRSMLAPQAQTQAKPIVAGPFASIADIRGQQQAKRALAIAAAGGHNLLMVGPPGTGKTMLAQALLSILPEPILEEMIEVTQIYSAAGLLGSEPFVGYRPFRAPHQTASPVAVIGGGQIPRPGEISLAHRGVLFLDELPEFRRDLLEALRQPLESGSVVVSRVRGNLAFPARFMLVAAMNPCPCGYHGDPEKACTCAPYEVLKYQKKVSGPLLDRIDIQISVPRIGLGELRAQGSDDVTVLRGQVKEARQRQQRRIGERLTRSKARSNSELSSKETERLVALDAYTSAFLEKAFAQSLISPRGYYRILKVAQTIADLAGRDRISVGDLSEAFTYRLREQR